MSSSANVAAVQNVPSETIVSDRRNPAETRNDADVTITTDGLNVGKVTDDEVVEHEAILADGRKLSVKGRFRKVPIAQLYRWNNPREIYDVDDVVQSIRLHGFWQNEPLMTVERDNPDNPDEMFLVVRGNRRLMAIQTICEDYPDDAKIIFPDGKVACIAYPRCNDTEVELLRMDFDKRAGKRDLDGWELFLAVRNLVAVGIHTESGIAQLLGLVKDDGNGSVVPNRSFVQPRVNLAKMPVDVQNLFMLALRGKTKETALRVTDIMPLARAFRAAKMNPDAPAFREKLDTLKSKTVTVKAESDDSAKPLSRKDLMNRVNSLNCPVLRRILKVVIFGEATDTLNSLDTLLIRHLPDVQDVPELAESDDSPASDDSENQSDTPEGWDSVGTSDGVESSEG